MGKKKIRKVGKNWKRNKKELILILIILGVILILLGCVFYFFEKPELLKNLKGGLFSEKINLQDLCGNNICENGEDENSCAVDCGFVFTFWPVSVEDGKTNFSLLDDLMSTGMTYAGVSIYSPTVQSELDLAKIKFKGYKIAQEISAGHYSDELVGENDNGNQFLKAPCLDKIKCDYWNSTFAVDPSYTGILWQNTINRILGVTAKAMPDLLFFDTEIWKNPRDLEYYFNEGDPNQDCNCNIIQQGIGYDAYNSNWLQRGLDLKNAVKQVSPNTKVSFFGEIPLNGVKWYPYYDGRYFSETLIYFPSETGDFSGPALYYLPNLEVLERNMQSMNLSKSIPYFSYSYYISYSNYNNRDVYFDASVSREMGRMLRKAGAKGFYIWPSAESSGKKFNGQGYNYWLNHAKEMTTGFKEGLVYAEENKIKNPDFESFKIISSSPSIQDARFSPVFWNWIDTNLGYAKNAVFENLSTDKQSGTYSWRHSRLGDIGNRTIYSNNFTINLSEAGNYKFSAYAKSSINSENSKIIFYINNSGDKENKIAELGFKDYWDSVGGMIFLDSGTYFIKMVIEGRSLDKIDILLDNVSLVKIYCGNNICESGEDCNNCAVDCRSCPAPCVNCVSETSTGFAGTSIIPTKNISENKTANISISQIIENNFSNEPIEIPFAEKSVLGKKISGLFFVAGFLFILGGILVAVMIYLSPRIFKKIRGYAF